METPVCPTCGCSLVRLGIGKDEAVSYRHNDQANRFCCEGCVEVFVTDPEKYIHEVSNLTVCPVCLGEKLLESTVEVVHAGGTLRFCRCPHCTEEFEKNPDHYLGRWRDDWLRPPGMKVEILYFEGCPAYGTAEKTLKEVLADEDIEANVTLVAVNTDEEARTIRFPGSPTIRADGRDLFPVIECEDWQPGCRIYATPEGLKGSPTVEMLREALERSRDTYADGNP